MITGLISVKEKTMKIDLSNIGTVPRTYTCEHCKQSYRKESTLMNHMCEKKRRAMQEGENRVKVGFMVFNRFMETFSRKPYTPKTYQEFCDNSFYNTFVKFGSYVSNIKPIYPDKFIEFIIRSNKKVDDWCNDALYEEYLYNILKVEQAEAALRRSLETLVTWGDENKTPFNEFFVLAASNSAIRNGAVRYIADGKLSPWLVLNSVSGYNMLATFNDEQLEIVSKVIDMPHWERTFRAKQDDVKFIKDVCKEVGIK